MNEFEEERGRQEKLHQEKLEKFQRPEAQGDTMAETIKRIQAIETDIEHLKMNEEFAWK